MSTLQKVKWYKNTYVVLLLMFLVAPVGIALMWMFTSWSRTVKVILSVVVILAFIGTITSDKSKVANIQTSDSRPTIQTAQNKIVNQITNAPKITEEPKQKTEKFQYVKVTKVIDGDTIEVEGGVRVRYIGIDTPETVDPRKAVQCFGHEASSKNKDLVYGRDVKLEKDISEVDKYGRLLRYVWVGDVLVNEYLVRNGFAHASSYPPDIHYQSLFTSAEQDAITNSRGLWSSCSNIQTATQPTNYPKQEPLQASGECNIKGNINSEGEKIFHIVGCQSYEKTKIDTSKGEKWFCSEEEAINAGWRKAGNCL